MVDVKLRSVEGRPLTFKELDDNWINLKNAIESIPAGDNGLSAYQIAQANGFVGDEAAWLASLSGDDGESAYALAAANGFVGTEAAWLASLQGADGAAAGVGQYVTTIGNGSDTFFTITHNLGTRDISVFFRPINPVGDGTFPPLAYIGDSNWSADDGDNIFSLRISEIFASRTDDQIVLAGGILEDNVFSAVLPTDSISVQVIGGGVGSAEYEALKAEVETARGDRSNLNNRITTISNFASPNAGGIVVGNYYDNSFQGTASGTLAGATNRVVMAPFYTSERLRIDQLGIAISTAVASSSLKCFIYGSDASGWPDELLYEGSSDLSGATTGYKSHSLDFTFDSGRQYWLGVKMNSTATYRTLNVSSAVNLGLSGNNATSYYTVITRTLTYANALPDPWSFVSTDLAASSPPSIRMRAAALP